MIVFRWTPDGLQMATGTDTGKPLLTDADGMVTTGPTTTMDGLSLASGTYIAALVDGEFTYLTLAQVTAEQTRIRRLLEEILIRLNEMADDALPADELISTVENLILQS